MNLNTITPYGPGDSATWGPPTGHPNDPRCDADWVKRMHLRALEILIKGDVGRGKIFDPLDPENLLEALSQADLGHFVSLVLCGSHQKAVEEIIYLSTDYWRNKSEAIHKNKFK